jgi:hypothetical protein
MSLDKWYFLKARTRIVPTCVEEDLAARTAKMGLASGTVGPNQFRQGTISLRDDNLPALSDLVNQFGQVRLCVFKLDSLHNAMLA